MAHSLHSNTFNSPVNVSIWHIGLSIIGLVFAKWVLHGIYRLYFHPLSSFPGPKVSAFTRLPYLVALWRGDLSKHVARLHEKYGEVVRVQPDELSFVHPHAWRDIYGYGSKGGQGSAPPKAFQRYAPSVNGVDHLIRLSDNQEHGRVRRIFSPAFSDRALTQQAPLFTKYADQLVEVLKDGSRTGMKFDMVRMWNFTTFDVMGDLTFGESLHMLDNAEYDPWVKIMFESLKQNVLLGIIYYYYPIAGKVVRKLFHRIMARKTYKHMEFSRARVNKRMEKGRASQGVDIWDLVLQQEDKGKQTLSRLEMDSNASLFMIAGTETTATLLSGLTYLLLKSPQSLKKLVEEIRTTFTSSDQISMVAIQALPYVNACIKEALRMYPPVPVGLPHQTPHAGSTICGHYIPPGAIVASHHLAMYMSPTMFKDPKSFIPERWTGDEKYANDQRAALQPFSVGSRDCLGKNMAYHEMRLLLTKVLYNFDLELCPESEGWIESQGMYTLWEKKPLNVKMTVAARA